MGVLGILWETASIAYTHAAIAGNSFAMRSLAWMYRKGEVFDKDSDQSFDWMIRAAERGYVPAYYDLATMILGQDERDRYPAAERLLLAALDHGVDQAAYRLSTAYAAQLSTSSNADQRLPLLSRAAKAGITKARIELAEHQFHGRNGVRVDRDQSCETVRGLSGDSVTSLDAAVISHCGMENGD